MLAGSARHAPQQGSGVSAVRPIFRHRVAAAFVGVAMVAVLVGGGLWLRYYWTVGRYVVSTEDAYVMSDATMVTAPASGVFVTASIHDDAHVGRGQLVAMIGDEPIRSAFSGTVRHVFAAAGEAVRKGTDLWSIAPDGRAYVVAGFKTSQLAPVHAGQSALIRLRGFPNLRIHGRVAPLPDIRRTSLSTPRGSSRPSTDPRVAIRIDLDHRPGRVDWLVGLPVRLQIDTKPAGGERLHGRRH